MVWREEDHPRDDGGRFTDSEKYYPTNSLEPYRRHRSVLPETIKLPDEQLPRSVGAKWKNEKISMPNGTFAKFLDGSKLQHKEVFAGCGTRTPIRNRYDLAAAYPGSSPEKWQKIKAKAHIVTQNDEIIYCEIHWYEEPTIGKVDFKYKKSL